MRRFKVLFIDDDLDYYRLAGMTLRSGNIDVALSKQESLLSELADGGFGIALLSMDMIEAKSYILLNKIRRFSNIPILAYTKKTVAFERINALNEGADDAVTLPIDGEELIARIKALIRRSDNMPLIDFFSDLVRGNLYLSIKSHTATVNGDSVKMTRLELSIAHFLCSHPHKVYSKQFLFNKFWGEESGTDPHTVDVHIYNIRSKLAECDCGEFKTVKKAGYKFVLYE